ncbi:putative membrane protein [Streptantibioticus cattleyicolor NRRL 8057 = DSM 46488]|nr:putative membrane protein [Streptantibioticus cattleyicolor NRRL 8057 = DSM 46488]
MPALRRVPVGGVPGRSARRHRRPLTAAFRGLTALAAGAGVALGAHAAPSASRFFGYFAVEANCLLALVSLWGAWRAWSGRRPLPAWLTGAAMIYVTLGALLFHGLLTEPASGFTLGAPFAPPTAPHRISAQLLHTVTPTAAVCDWLLLTAPARFRPAHAVLWPAFPLAHLGYALHRHALLLPGAFTRFPHPFLPLHPHAYQALTRDAALLVIPVWLLTILTAALDHLRPTPPPAGTGFRLRSPVR